MNRDRESRFTMEDIEFSEFGRSDRFLPGWWIVPGVLAGAALLVWLIG